MERVALAILPSEGVLQRGTASSARLRGGVWSLRKLAGAGTPSGRSGAGEDEHPLQIPRHRHEGPLAAHFVEAAQQELTESERRFDDAEHRLRRLLRKA